MPIEGIDPDGMVRLHNETDEPIALMYGLRVFRIQPNKDAFVPFPLMCYHMGDPRTKMEPVRMPLGDKVTFLPTREQEITRLSVLYGTYNPNDTALIISRQPKVTGYRIDGDSERFIFPCEDPKCLLSLDIETIDQNSFLEDQLHSLKNQVLIMQQMLDNKNNATNERLATLPEDQRPSTFPSGEDESDSLEEDRPNILITGARD